ncbi:MAG TPA: hypothetical protein VGX96_18410 [Candidatus Elarobacter sp.]|jgi:hypothetical protein|nr:hypothetical protein [Candidatus Elarobacter sp.]
MLKRTLHLAALAAGTALALGPLGLAGCSTGSNSTVIHTPALQTSGGRATARSSVQTTILAVTALTGLAVPGGLTPTSAIRTVRSVLHGRRTLATGASTGACTNGTKQSQTTASDGSVTTTTDLYYEPACVTLENEEIVKVSPPATTPATGSGTLVTYDKSGALTSSHVLALASTTTGSGSSASETITLTDNASASVGGTVIDQLGETCVGAPNAVAMTCSIAHVGTTGGTTTGEAVSTTSTAGTNGANATASIGAAFYFGSIGITQSGTTWSVTNAGAFNSGTGSYGYASTGTKGSGTLTLTDNLYTYSETATLASTGLSVTLIQKPNAAFNTTSNIATATTDAGGNGTMSYADGTVEPIWGGLIGV